MVMTVFVTCIYNSLSTFHVKIVLDNYTNRLGLIRGEQEAALEDMVAIAGQVMSDSRLSTEFKKVYRMTPLEVITRSRMHVARKLLRTTDMPVKDIAVECGYYDISGFNRRFKAYTSMTPQQYKLSSEAAGDQREAGDEADRQEE